MLKCIALKIILLFALLNNLSFFQSLHSFVTQSLRGPRTASVNNTLLLIITWFFPFC